MAKPQNKEIKISKNKQKTCTLLPPLPSWECVRGWHSWLDLWLPTRRFRVQSPAWSRVELWVTSFRHTVRGEGRKAVGLVSRYSILGLRVRSIKPYSVYSGIRIKFQNSLLIRRTIKFLVKNNDWGERYN